MAAKIIGGKFSHGFSWESYGYDTTKIMFILSFISKFCCLSFMENFMRETLEYYENNGMQPVHLPSLQHIMQTFTRNRKTVLEWYNAGAPIGFDGKRYFTEYNMLARWLVSKYRKKMQDKHENFN